MTRPVSLWIDFRAPEQSFSWFSHIQQGRLVGEHVCHMRRNNIAVITAIYFDPPQRELMVMLKVNSQDAFLQWAPIEILTSANSLGPHTTVSPTDTIAIHIRER